MTTDALSTPIETFRASRNDLLAAFLSSMNGLEVSVLAFDSERSRRLEQAESDLAEALAKNRELSAELGEKADGQADAVKGGAELAEALGNVARLEAEISELRNTLPHLPPAHGAIDIPGLEPEESAATVESGEGIDPALAAAKARVVELEAEAEQAAGRIASLESSLDEASLQLASAAARADEADSRAAALEADLDTKTEEFARERLDAADTAARDALRVLSAVAADEPKAPLSEAVELVGIALGVDVPVELSPAAVEPALDAVDLPLVPDLDDFDALIFEEPLETADGLSGGEGPGPDPLASVSVLEPLVFEDAAESVAEPASEPSKGFGFFGRKKADKAA